MKKLWLALFFLILSLGILVQCQSPTPPTQTDLPTKIGNDLLVIPLNTRTYVVRDISFYKSNVLVSKMPDDTVVIASSFVDTVKTQALVRWLKRRWRPKRIVAINTHFHADGTGGNEAFRLEKVEIWSSHQTHKLYHQRAQSMRVNLAKFVKGPEQSRNILQRKNQWAHKFFDQKDGVQWNFGGEKVVVTYPGAAHTPDNLIVFFPQQKILFGGCMVRPLEWSGLGNIDDADLSAYGPSVQSLIPLAPKIVVPGHGKVGDLQLLHHTIKMAKSQSSKKKPH